MDQVRIDIFLDEGWCLIDQLHQWSTGAAGEDDDRVVLFKLIHGLQKLWSMAVDLQLNRLARTILAIEQTLERICARAVALNGDRVDAVTSGIQGLQALLLGFEATREEPCFENFDALRLMERSTHQACLQPDQKSEPSDPIATPNLLNVVSDNSKSDSAIVPTTNSVFDTFTSELAIDPSRVALLEQFTAKLESTCRRLHARIVADEAPYVTTTSRLEHLAEQTRALAEQILREVHSTRSDIVKFERENPPCSFTLTIEQPRVEATYPAHRAVISHVEPVHRLDDASQLKRLTSTGNDESRTSNSTNLPAATDRARVLIVEESMFYRHLFGIAVQSGGYEPLIAETVAQGLDALLKATECSAVLVSAMISPAMVVAIEQRRRTGQLKVIGMTLPGQEKVPVADLDARISKMHPQQLVAALDKLLIDSRDRPRKSA